jgi:hypothetical protein
MKRFPPPTEQELREGSQSVTFQIAHGNARYSCRLQTDLPTQAQARKFLLAHWIQVEKMARDYLESGIHDAGEVKLSMP